ncbi:MAG: homocysteine S-methyltransferase family protein, partial [Pirellulales bacterium]|nr:homocysteine S-methyltransferase family protein [Pirellulales bacterium]
MPMPDVTEQLEQILEERILVLDGATGTQIQDLGLDEAAIRGERLAGHDKDLKNFADILCLTRPDDMTAIHGRYLQAGADIIVVDCNVAGGAARRCHALVRGGA